MKVNVVGKNYSEAERAYLAGFIDADGAIMATIEHHKEKRFRFRVRVILKITQCNKSSLDWFIQTFKVGAIRKNRTAYDWLIRNQKDVNYLLNLIEPFSKTKARQVDIAKTILAKSVNKKEDLLKIARSADALSKFNVRSKGRRKNHATMIQEYFSCND